MPQHTLWLLSLLFSLPVFATPPAAADATDRIGQYFLGQQDASAYWQRGWLTLFSASAAGQGLIAATSGSERERYNARTGAITSALGAADMLLNPMRTHEYAAALQQGDVSREQAEQWLAAAAAREQYERSLTNHLLAGLVNALAGLAIAYDDKRPDDGWLTFATGMLASEIKIATAPTGMTAAWQAWQRGEPSPPAAAMTPPTRWSVAAAGPVLYLQLQF